MQLGDLRDRLDGIALTPGDHRFRDEVLGYNRLVEHHPRVVIGAASTSDVAQAVRLAAEHGWSVGVMATGHGGTVAAPDVLITTRRMNRHTVDPDRRVATVEAGVRGRDLVAAAGLHGLAYLGGSSPAVSVVGYLSGGGLPIMGRAYGYGAERVRRLTLVTADGVVRQLDRTDESGLFWGALGAKDNLGVITDVEVELLPLAEVNAGGLWWTGDSVTAATGAYLDWTDDLPDEMCSSMLVMSMPDADFAPRVLRGKHFVHVRLIHPGEAGAALRVVQPLRRVPGLVQDTFGRLPATALGSVHAEPDQPTRFEARASRLGRLDQPARTRLVGALAAACPFLVEVRHLGGKLGLAPTGPVSYADADFGLYTGQAVPPGEDRASGAGAQREFHAALEAWRVGSLFSFLSGPTAITVSLADCYTNETITRLRQVKKLADPTNLFRLNVNVSPEDGARP